MALSDVTSSATLGSTFQVGGSSLSVPQLPNLVTVKLTDSNYLLWRQQVRPFLIGQNFWRFIDGSYPQPAQFLAAIGNNPPALNPDQTLVSLLTATLTEPILAMIVGLNTTQEIWNCLQQHFSQQSVANSTTTRFRLLSITKDNRSISEYLQYAKSLADTLAAIGEPVTNTDLVSAVLRGLGPDYAMFVTAVFNFPPLPLFSDLRARLLSFEAQISVPPQVPPTTLMATQSRGNIVSYSAPPNSGSGYQNTRGGNNRNRNNRNRNYRHNNRGSGPRSFAPICQLCNDNGHTAPQCSQRYVRSPAPHQAFAGLQLSQPPPPSQQYLPPSMPYYQHPPPPYRPITAVDPNWYPDTGATNHMTGDQSALQNPTPYSGMDNVLLGNGTHLPITHTGNIPLQLGSYSFQLRNVYHIPEMRKNLLSVAQFTKDNHVL